MGDAESRRSQVDLSRVKLISFVMDALLGIARTATSSTACLAGDFSFTAGPRASPATLPAGASGWTSKVPQAISPYPKIEGIGSFRCFGGPGAKGAWVSGSLD